MRTLTSYRSKLEENEAVVKCDGRREGKNTDRGGIAHVLRALGWPLCIVGMPRLPAIHHGGARLLHHGGGLGASLRLEPLEKASNGIF